LFDRFIYCNNVTHRARRKQYMQNPLHAMYTLYYYVQHQYNNRRITIVFAIFRNCFLLSEIKLEQRYKMNESFIKKYIIIFVTFDFFLKIKSLFKIVYLYDNLFPTLNCYNTLSWIKIHHCIFVNRQIIHKMYSHYKCPSEFDW
jgi:hypothetical protein